MSSPAVTIVKSHTGNFAQGQTGATYTVTVSDTAGASPTSGTVTVTDTLPPGLTASAISGTGWSCTLATLTCTRSDVLAAGSSYPAITVTVNVAGNATSPQINMVSVSGGGSATASATDTTTIVGTGVPAISVTPTSGSGLQQTFSFLASDGLGATDLSTIYAMFNATFSGINSCMVEYCRPANTLYLLNDAGIVWSAATIGSATVLSNSQCSVNAATTTAILSGNNLTLALPVTFASADGGAKNTYGYAAGSIANSGWQPIGAWTVPSPGIPPGVTAGPVSPNSGSGLQQTFTFQYADGVGANDLSTMYALFNATFSGTNSCLVEYYRPANTLYLLNDAATLWSSATIGSTTPLSNSQCSINAATTSVSVSGVTLTLTLPVTFASADGGAMNTYAYAAGSAANSGWQTLGTWTVPSPGPAGVTAGPVSPNSGSGLQQTFTFQYSDGVGANDLSTMFVLINATFAGINSCLVEYDRPANTLYLLNDVGTAWSSATVGAATVLSNSQCSVNAATTSVSVSGAILTLGLPVTFASADGGAKNTYAYAAGSAANSGWVTIGAWTVPSPGIPPGVTAGPVSPNSGSGLQQTFTFQYADGVGANDLSTTYALFSATFSGTNACMIEYYRPGNIIYLLNDAGTTWSSATIGSTTVLSNSQCSVNAATTTVSVSGANLTLTLPITFTSAFAGAKNIYAYAAGSSANSGWQGPIGTWTVP